MLNKSNKGNDLPNHIIIDDLNVDDKIAIANNFKDFFIYIGLFVEEKNYQLIAPTNWTEMHVLIDMSKSLLTYRSFECSC